MLFAWLCANGALLDVVQVVAWGKMLSNYTTTMSVAAALDATFDPAKPCEMCVGVAAAKEDLAQKRIPGTIEQNSVKLVLAFESPAAFVWTHVPDSWPNGRACTGP